MDSKLREKIAKLIDECEDDFYRKEHSPEALTSQILALTKEALPELAKEDGYVKLDKDQKFPGLENIESGISSKTKKQWFIDGQCFAYDKAYKEGWRKVGVKDGQD